MSDQNFKTFDWSYDTGADAETSQIKGSKLFFLLAIFILIIFFTKLFLCAHWVFRNRNLPESTNNALLTPRFYSRSQSQGLDPDAIKKLPIKLYQTDCSNRELEEKDCCICLSVFGDGDKLKVLPGCEHCFHCECVDAWLVNHSNCPLCRGSLKLDLFQDIPVIEDSLVVALDSITDSSVPRILVGEDSVIEHSLVVALNASRDSSTESSLPRILIQEPPIRYNLPL